MIEAILLLVIPCICYGLADSKLDDEQTSHTEQQTKRKPKQNQNKRQTASKQVREPEQIDSLFLDDDFDINDIIRNRSNK